MKMIFNNVKKTFISLIAIGSLGTLFTYNVNANAKQNKLVSVKRTRVHLKGSYLYNNLKMRQRTHINNKKTYIYSKKSYIKNKGLYKYVTNGKNKGWISAKNVQVVHSKNHKKLAKDKIYKPNAENVKKEFIKLLDPYLKRYNKTYGKPSNMRDYLPNSGSDGYGGEYVATSGTLVQSDKAMAKSLFDGLYHGTLKKLYLTDPSQQYVILDHINFDGDMNITNPNKTPLGIDARLYLTWYSNMNIHSPYEIDN